MRITLNLASRPFVELRPVFLRLRVIMAALLGLGVALAIGAHLLQAKVTRAQKEMDGLRQQTIVAQQEKLHNEQRMRQPANAAVLDRAHFLNALFLRKSFSWTAVMMDLENVLPSGVQITSIEPQISADGEVVIRLRVSGDRDRAVQLVRNLERSRRFLQPRLTGEATQAKEAASSTGSLGTAGATGIAPGVQFEILADYNPLPAGEAYAAVRVASREQVVPVGSANPGVPSNGARRLRTRPLAQAGQSRGDGVVLQPYAPGLAPRPVAPLVTGGPR